MPKQETEKLTMAQLLKKIKNASESSSLSTERKVKLEELQENIEGKFKKVPQAIYGELTKVLGRDAKVSLVVDKEGHFVLNNGQVKVEIVKDFNFSEEPKAEPLSFVAKKTGTPKKTGASKKTKPSAAAASGAGTMAQMAAELAEKRAANIAAAAQKTEEIRAKSASSSSNPHSSPPSAVAAPAAAAATTTKWDPIASQERSNAAKTRLPRTIKGEPLEKASGSNVAGLAAKLFGSKEKPASQSEEPKIPSKLDMGTLGGLEAIIKNGPPTRRDPGPGPGKG